MHTAYPTWGSFLSSDPLGPWSPTGHTGVQAAIYRERCLFNLHLAPYLNPWVLPSISALSSKQESCLSTTGLLEPLPPELNHVMRDQGGQGDLTGPLQEDLQSIMMARRCPPLRKYLVLRCKQPSNQTPRLMFKTVSNGPFLS